MPTRSNSCKCTSRSRSEIALETDGTQFYDRGEQLAYKKLLRKFARERYPVIKGRLGVLGATPLNTGLTSAAPIVSALKQQGWEDVVCFGMDSGLDEIRRASACERILVIAPSGLQAAEFLESEYGIPYETGYPCLPELLVQAASALRGKRVLIVHQQMAANALRGMLTDCEADCATWFLPDRRFAAEHDFRIRSEGDLQSAAENYDVIIADNMLRRAVPRFTGQWLHFPHYAVSGSAKG